MKKTLHILLLAAVLCGCKELPLETPDPVDVTDPSEEDAEPLNLEGYKAVPLTSRTAGLQPMTGIVLWTDHNKASTDAIQLEFAYMLYNDVCKAKDTYDWSVVENLLNKVASHKHQAVIRFRYTYVGKSCAVPDYIKKWPGYEETKGKSEGQTTYFPDWRCEELQRFHLEFHRLFAEKYDKDPRLAFLETGFGLWAEYHIYSGPFILGKTFPSKEFQAQFFQGMEQWFKETPWCISIDAADPTYGPFKEHPELLKGRFGNFDDSFMCEDHDGYNTESWRYFGEDRYKRAPLGGEFSYYTDYDQEHCLDKSGLHGRRFENEAASFHMSFIIGNDQPDYQELSRIREAGMATGYRFVIKELRVKGDKNAAVFIANEGVAPIYRDAFLALDGVQGAYNLRKLMPGEGVWVPFTLTSPISSSPAFSVVCAHLVKGQEISLAISPQNS